LVSAYDDETVSDVAFKLQDRDFSQIPIRDRITGNWIGVVTDLGVLKMLLPNHDPVIKDRAKIGSLLISESGLVEGILECPYTESLIVVAQMLVYSYAVLLKNNLGELKGIITRADILQLVK